MLTSIRNDVSEATETYVSETKKSMFTESLLEKKLEFVVMTNYPC